MGVLENSTLSGFLFFCNFPARASPFALLLFPFQGIKKISPKEGDNTAKGEAPAALFLFPFQGVYICPPKEDDNAAKGEALAAGSDREKTP